MPIPAQTGSLGSKVLTDTASALAARRDGDRRPGDIHQGFRRTTAVGKSLTTDWNPADHLQTWYEGALAPDHATPFDRLIVQSTSFRNIDCDCRHLPLRDKRAQFDTARCRHHDRQAPAPRAAAAVGGDPPSSSQRNSILFLPENRLAAHMPGRVAQPPHFPSRNWVGADPLSGGSPDAFGRNSRAGYLRVRSWGFRPEGSIPRCPWRASRMPLSDCAARSVRILARDL